MKQVGLALVSLFSASLTLASEPGVKWCRDATAQPPMVVKHLDWCRLNDAGATCVDQVPTGCAEGQPRITEHDWVRIEVVNFNAFNFVLKTEQSESTVEVYKALLKPWTRLLDATNPLRVKHDSRAALAPTPADDWLAAVLMFDTCLSTQTTAALGLSSEYLTEAGRKVVEGIQAKLAPAGDGMAAECPSAQHLGVLRTAALTSVPGGALNADEFRLLDEYHAELEARRAVLLKNARDSLIQVSFTIPPKEAGTAVSHSVFSEGTMARGRSRTQYLAETTLPLYFHVGGVVHGTSKSDFKAVASTSGEDLFSRVSSGSTSTDLAAFLTYPLGGAPAAGSATAWSFPRVGLSLGTGVDDPGGTWYVGLSGKFDRYVLTVGSSIEKAKKGEDKVDDGGRPLFRRLREKYETDWFVAISYVLYGGQ